MYMKVNLERQGLDVRDERSSFEGIGGSEAKNLALPAQGKLREGPRHFMGVGGQSKLRGFLAQNAGSE